MTTFNTEQKVNLVVSPLTAKGKPAKVTGVPLWNSSNVNAISLVVAADGLSAYAIGGAEGVSTVSVIANAGTEDAPVQICASVDITVVTAPAASLSVSVGTVENQ